MEQDTTERPAPVASRAGREGLARGPGGSIGRACGSPAGPGCARQAALSDSPEVYEYGGAHSRAISARMARTGEAYNATARPGDRERQADGPSS